MQSPEPRIGYGAFDTNGSPIQPGHCGSTLIGYGILNLPANFGSHVTDTPDDGLLTTYLENAKKRWERDALVARFEAHENKLELLIGTRIADFYLYSDETYFSIRLPHRGTTRHAVTLIWGTNQVCYGIHTRDEISSELYGRMPTSITNVEKDVITLESGFQFALTGRFADKPPVYQLDLDLKAELIRSLDMRVAERDSATVQ